MNSTKQDLVILLCPGGKDNEEMIDRQARFLTRDLASLEDVQAARLDGLAEKGAMGDPITIGTIAITLLTGGVITEVVRLLRDWILRGEQRKVIIRLTKGKNKIELEYVPQGDAQEDLEKFVSRLSFLLKS